MLAGGGDQALFGTDDPLRGVAVGAGDGVHRRPVCPPQLSGLLDAIRRRRQGDRALQNVGDEEVDQRVWLLGGKLDGADCRSASARMCHTCQVDRLPSSTVTMRSAACATQ